MIKCIAVDDEPLSMDIIQAFAKQTDGIEVMGCFTDAHKASEFLASNDVQLIFLDIQMPDMNGLEFYRNYGIGKMVVFTTAYSEFAFEGFNVQAVDFLVKPFDLPRFQQACKKAEEFMKLKAASGEPMAEYVTIKSDYKYNLINIKDILYVESKDDYVKFILKDQKFILSKMTTKSTQNMLPDHAFMRIHRSFIINRGYLASLSSSMAILTGGVKLPIGRKYKDEVLASIGQ